MRFLYIPILSLLFLISCSSAKTQKDYVFPKADEKAKYITAYDKALRLWNVAYEETDVKTIIGNVHVVMCGPIDGEPIVLFHGMDASSTMWYPNIKALSEKHRIYSIDFPLETGKSNPTQAKLNNKQITIFYDEIFNHFQLKDINLIGASRGGWMAAHLALQQYSRIKRLVLLSPAQTFGGMKQPFKVLTAVKLKVLPNQKRLDRFFEVFSKHPEKIDNAYKEQFYLANVYGNSRPRYIKMLQFSKKKLHSLKIPVLVLVGDHDIVSDEKTLEKAKQLLPNVETAYIKDAGHFLSIDQAEIVNQKIVDFLNR